MHEYKKALALGVSPFLSQSVPTYIWEWKEAVHIMHACATIWHGEKHTTTPCVHTYANTHITYTGQTDMWVEILFHLLGVLLDLGASVLVYSIVLKSLQSINACTFIIHCYLTLMIESLQQHKRAGRRRTHLSFAWIAFQRFEQGKTELHLDVKSTKMPNKENRIWPILIIQCTHALLLTGRYICTDILWTPCTFTQSVISMQTYTQANTYVHILTRYPYYTRTYMCV